MLPQSTNVAAHVPCGRFEAAKFGRYTACYGLLNPAIIPNHGTLTFTR